MNTISKTIALVGFAVLCAPQIGSANPGAETTRTRMNQTTSESKFQQLVDRSVSAYSAIVKGPHGQVPDGVLNNARCIAVLPKVITGAIVVGGSRGNGLASCKNSNGSWSQPAPISLTEGSIGVQAGAKSSDLVLFFQTAAAEAALKSGDFKFGGEVSAVAGKFDAGFDSAKAGVVVYSQTKGVFAGASINGSRIGQNKGNVAEFYGKNVEFSALLDGKEQPDKTGITKNFCSVLPS